ncbi:MAG: AraC family transcriptional regulator [Candidatus Thiodiazotropha sp.]
MLATKESIPKLVKSSEVSRYSPGRVVCSSVEMGWKYIQVTRVIYDSEYLASSPRPATPDHSLVMMDTGSFSGQISYNQGCYRPYNITKYDWIIGQAFENQIDGFGELIQDDKQECAALLIHISPKFISKVAEEVAGIDGNRIELRHQVGIHDPLMTQIANALKVQLIQSDLYGNIFAETAAHLLAAHLLQKYSTYNKKLPKVKERIGKRLSTILEYIHANLHEDISIESLANISYMSPYYFIRWFKKQSGETPYQFILRQRMDRAKQLLINTDKPVIEIASETGYGYSCNFSNAFKQYTGITPKSFRNSNQ